MAKIIYILLYSSLMFTSLNAGTLKDKDIINVCIATNLKSDSGTRYLDVCLGILKNKQNTLIIKHIMIMMFSNKQLEEIVSIIGKTKAIKEFKKKSGLKEVIFTRFFIYNDVRYTPQVDKQ